MLGRLFSSFRGELALDLGTVNTLISAAGEGIVLDEPSVVAVEKQTGRILSGGCAVGHLARQLLGRTPDSIRVVRPVLHGVIADFELCEAMLRYFFRKAQRLGVRLKPRVLVCVPGCLTPVEKRAVFNSTYRAGANGVYLVEKAKAAAIGAGLPVVEPVASMVCDIGGGTTEVAVLSLADIVASASVRVGGDAMDEAIVGYFRRRYSLRVGASAAEELKRRIGSACPLEEEFVEEVRGLDAVSGLPRKATVTSEEIREALGEPLEAIAQAIRDTLDGLTPDLASDLMDHGMVLCGGGALLRGIDRFLAEQTGLPVRVVAEPLAAVARGALVCIEHFDRWRPSLQSSDEAL
ncbi:MAG TPA: rod shape-determining protein [Planctomycetaceae bacterium]|nr:rod shape-determining protein [Planctomycetaceae bacterium]